MKKSLPNIFFTLFGGFMGAFAFHLILPLFSTAPAPREMPLLEEPGRVRTVRKDPMSLSEGTLDFVQAAALSTPSVVYIKTVFDRYDQMSIFDLYFGEGLRGRKSIGSGSGVIFTADGYIVTNYHVIEDAERIEVIHRKKSYEAKVIGTDPSADLAIIKIEGQALPAIKRGSSKDLRVGEWVLAVGNPFDLESTVTAGIVSAKGRNINLLGGQFPLESFIQTDAAINPGNSGGALVNAKGELVGINTAILSRTGSYTGYGFAVPVDIVAKIFNDLIQYGQVQKAFMGLEVADLNSKIGDEMKLDLDGRYEGALITNVQANSQAQKLGLKKGDVVVQINGEPVNGKSNFEELVSYYRPGDLLKLKVRQGKSVRDLELTLTNREGTTDITRNEVYASEKIGVDLEPISKLEKEKLGVENGVRVVKVKRGLFARLGIQEGFILTSINRTPVSAPQQVEDILSNINGKVYIEAISPDGVKGYFNYYF
ncbi:MAG: PDZ domain-containing protein [Microscillaceae bacterium]|nr:PDZ domain-containing protein [Microscillaceae bacterium]